MKKILYIIPGYGESVTSTSKYRTIAKMFEAAGFSVIHIKISWHAKQPRQFKDYVREFLKQYKKPRNTECYILGFSFGAMIGFLSAERTKPKALIICSLSPYFIEDQKKVPAAWIEFWKKDFVNSDYSFTELASAVTPKTHLLVGSEEDPACLRRARDARRKIKNSTLSVIKGAKHDIGQKEYLAALEKLSRRL